MQYKEKAQNGREIVKKGMHNIVNYIARLKRQAKEY